MRFSQRIGVTPATKPIQLNSMDDDLRNGLWNAFSALLLNTFKASDEWNNLNRFALTLWHDFFKWKIEDIPERFYHFKSDLDTWFFDTKREWHEVYDFLEFCVIEVQFIRKSKKATKEFCETANGVLEREFSAYRFIKYQVSPITNESEIKEIEIALDNAEKFTALNGCNTHLSAALHHLSDKKSPDYRNSIKESVSAVESVAKVVAGTTKGTLHDALSALKTKIGLHKALEAGYKSIYGWAGDSGVRHGLMEEDTCDFDDAKYMLVSCSAFINYLISKAQKAGIEIK